MSVSGEVSTVRRRRPALMVLLATAAMAAPFGVAPALAQAQSGSAQGQARSFNIPPQSLASALTAFGDQADMQVTVDTALVSGLQSPGASGSLNPYEALSRILTGSGLTWRSLDSRTVRLERAPQSVDGAIQLGPVRVEGEASGSGTGAYVSLTSDPGATEGTGSYRARSTNTATKLILSPRETPSTIGIVTRQQMDDFTMASVEDALKSVSGIVVYDKGYLGNQYYSRGFEVQYQVDGVSNPAGIGNGNNGPQLDNAFLDRVEILQGAAGLMSGPGYPGGTINLVRKRPTSELQASTEGQVGSWNERRAMFDVSGPLVRSGAVRARAVGVMDNRDSFTDFAYSDRIGLYSIVEGDLTPSTMVTFSVEYQRHKKNNHLGVPLASDGSDLGLSRNSYFGDPDAHELRKYILYTASVEQKLSDAWAARVTYSHNEGSGVERRYGFTAGSVDRETGGGLFYYGGADGALNSDYDAFDAYLKGKVSLFGRQHELVFGANGFEYTYYYGGEPGYSFTPITFNAYNYDPYAATAIAGGDWSYYNGYKTKQWGLYAVARFDLADGLKAIVGSRLSWYKNDTYSGNSFGSGSASDYKEKAALSPYAGLTYDISKQLTLYVSYADIFNPQSYRDSSGAFLKPVIGSNYEAGVKAEFIDGNLNAAAAVFVLDQTNIARQDPDYPYDVSNACGGYCYIALDKIRSKGADLSVNGNITSNWNIAAGYTYVDSKYASGTSDGTRYQSALPQHNARLSTLYTFENIGLSFGGNIQARSSIHSSDALVTIDGVILAGLIAKYRLSSHADVSANVSNLFDKRYYASATNLNYNSFGEPRSFRVNLRYRF